MGATPNATERGTAAPSVVFQGKLFDEKAAALGAETEVDRAALCGVDRATLYRYRTGRTVPLLPEAMRFAACVGMTATDLWLESNADAA